MRKCLYGINGIGYRFLRVLTSTALLQCFPIGATLLGLCLSLSAQEAKSDLAHKFIAKGSDIKSLSGSGSEQTRDGRTIFGGDVSLATNKPYEGVRWLACANSDGQVLWSARAEEQPDSASLFPLSTDGDSIWHVGVLKNGLFRAAKFEAKTLRKQASVQMAFAPITTPAAYIGFHSGTEPDFDLQVSMIQPVGNSIRVTLFSRDLRLIMDKLYTVPLALADDASKTFAAAYVTRLPDRSGYYLFLRRPVRPADGVKPGIGIVRLENDGTVKWANSYAFGHDEFDVAPHVGGDGAILAAPTDMASNQNSIFIKIAPDGVPTWATDTKGLSVGMSDFSGANRGYEFTQPHLFLYGGQTGSGGLVSSVLAVNYQTGKIEKQVKLKSSGAAGFVAKTGDSLYLSLLDSFGPSGASTALLRLDFDLNLRAARRIRDSEPHFPLLDALPGGNLHFSYCYNDRKTCVVETVDENFASSSSCDVLQKADFSVVRTSFEARPIKLVTTVMPPIKVADANGKTNDANLALVPVELTTVACMSKSSR
jgi:hypothetical protein